MKCFQMEVLSLKSTVYYDESVTTEKCLKSYLKVHNDFNRKSSKKSKEQNLTKELILDALNLQRAIMDAELKSLYKASVEIHTGDTSVHDLGVRYSKTMKKEAQTRVVVMTARPKKKIAKKKINGELNYVK